jgi:hypothetical protein
MQRDYDYLILPRVRDKVVGLDEFRVDLKSGDKFQTDEATKKESSTRTDLERASNDLTRPQSGRPPASQGFATSWVHFYPRNRSQATFRYLGEEKSGWPTHACSCLRTKARISDIARNCSISGQARSHVLARCGVGRSLRFPDFAFADGSACPRARGLAAPVNGRYSVWPYAN